MSSIYQQILNGKAAKEKKFAVLVDPDKARNQDFDMLFRLAQDGNVDYFFVGGSLVIGDELDETILKIKANSDIPVILFPGSILQISSHADAILYLSLISGRNPELLIGNHVLAAPQLKRSGLEIISTGYMLIDSGRPTTASYMSNTSLIPHDKNDIALCTAMAGEFMGMKLIYMDGGSGAMNPISESMIKTVSKHIEVPMIIGGGIKTPEKALANIKAGADIIVVGNALEKSPTLLTEIANAIHSENYA
jgi:phosphoglycerol geranylgeranyltransferase